MSKTKAPAILDNGLAEKFDLLEETIQGEVFEREDEILGLLLAAVAGTTIFFLGPPGIAKSFLFDRFTAYVSGGQYFQHLMSKTTDPAELFGPPSLRALREDRFERMIDGTLVTASHFFLDEIFKTNSAIANTLLWIINERMYRNGTTLIRPAGPTWGGTASNELPQDDSMKAFYDRLVIRFMLAGLQDTESFEKMLNLNVDPNPTPILSHDDIARAQSLAAQVLIPPAVIEATTDIRRKLKDKQIEPSDRRFMRLMQVVKAYAWLDGCNVADIEHLAPAENILWERPEQRGDVSQVVLELANPLDQEANVLLQELSGLEDDLDSLAGSDDDKYTAGNEIHNKLLRAGEELEKLETRAGGSRKRSKRLKATGDKILLLTDRVLVEVFNLPPENAAKAS